MYVIMLGPPGVGKSTQAPALAAHLGIRSLAAGDLFRAIAASGTELGRDLDARMRRGDLLPDELVVQLISERLRSVDFEQGAVLDGCPSTKEQAVGLDRELALRGQRFEHVVHLYAPIDVLLERLSHRASAHRAGEAPAGGPATFPSGNSEGQHNSQARPPRRQDDAPHVVRRRLEVYIQNIRPVVEYYQAQGVVREVMADAPKEEVKARVIRAIGLRISFPEVGRDEDEKQYF